LNDAPILADKQLVNFCGLCAWDGRAKIIDLLNLIFVLQHFLFVWYKYKIIPLMPSLMMNPQSLILFRQYLIQFASANNFDDVITSIFGSDVDQNQLQEIKKQWLTDDFSIVPLIEIRTSAELNGSYGAFSKETGKIYLSQEFLDYSFSETIASVLLEEYGHLIDAKLNVVDSPGDEGAIFSSFVQGKTLGLDRLQQLKTEDDRSTIILDSQIIEVEEASISDGGGEGGTNQQLRLDPLPAGQTSKGNVTVEYFYQHYTIPDQFTLLYDGKNIFDTGGLVSGSRSGKVTFARGNSDFITVKVTAPRTGTAWDFSVTTKNDLCPNTTPFDIQAVGGTFKDNDGDGDCEYSGTVTIGRTDGISKLIRVEGGMVEYDKTKLTVTGGTIYSQIGNVTGPLFHGDFIIPFNTGTTTSLTDDKRNNAGDLRLAGLDVNLVSLSLNRDRIGLGTRFKLPSEIGVSIPDISTPFDTISIKQSGVGLGISGKLSLNNPPKQKFSFFSLFDVESSDLSLEYIAAEDKLKLQGKFALGSFIKDSSAKITADLAGDNFIEIKDGKADVKGSLTIATGITTSSGWGLNELALNIDTKQKDVGGSTKITFPFKGSISEVDLGVGFKISPLELNKVSINVDNLNVPIPAYPLVFFQRFAGAVENFAPSDTDPIEFSGGVGATLGPQFEASINFPQIGLSIDTGRVALIRLDVDGKISSTELSGTGKITVLSDKLFTGTGTTKFNWNDKFLEQSGTFSLIDGLFKTSNSFKVDSSWNINMGGKASVNIPSFIDVFGGKNLTNADFLLNYTNNSTFSDDYAAVWTTLRETILGVDIDIPLGFRAFFDGRLELIASGVPPSGQALAPLSAQEIAGSSLSTNTLLEKSALISSNIAAPSGAKWILLTADWENSSASTKIRIKKPDGTFIEEPDFAANNISLFNALNNFDTRAAVVINPTPGVWSAEVVDSTGLGKVSYTTKKDSVAPTVQITSPVSDLVSEGAVAIGYSAFDLDSTANIKLFYDNNDTGLDGILITDSIKENDGAGSFTWNTEGIPTGEYYIYAMAMDNENAPVYSSYSKGKVKAVGSADLSIDSVISSGVAVANTDFTYKLTIKNNGASTAKDVVLNDALSSDVKFVSASKSPDAQQNNNLTFNLGDILSGETKTVDVVVKAPSSSVRTSNTATVTSKTFDPSINNNTSILTTLVQATSVSSTDLSLTAVSNNTPLKIGDKITYDFTVTNNGTDTATGIIVKNSLPSELQNLVFGSGANSSSISFEDLKAGQSKTISITGDTIAAGDLTLTSVVESSSLDANESNNSIILQNTVEAANPTPADLELSLTVDKPIVKAGEDIILEITLANKGAGAATAIQVKDLLPQGLAFVSFSAQQGSYDPITGIWTAGNIAKDNTASLSIKANVTTGGSIFNLAEVISVSEVDPDSTPGNNNLTEDDIASVTIDAKPLFGIQKATEDIWTATGSGKVKVAITGKNSNQLNEIGVFKLAADNTVNGIAVGAAGFTQAALANSTTLFTALPDNTTDGLDLSHIFNVANGDRLGFFMVANGTIEENLKYNKFNNVVFSIDPANPGSKDYLQVTEKAGAFTLDWEQGNDNNFQDLSISLTTDSSPESPLSSISSLQGQPAGEILDLRAFAGQNLQATFTIKREAAYNNVAGFYKIDDLEGTVTSLTGAKLKPQDSGYKEAALSNKIAGLDIIGENQKTITIEQTVTGGAMYAPYLIINGNNPGFAANLMYTAFSQSNFAQADRVRLLGENTFGFEDLIPQGGDFNDLVVQAIFKTV
jgi:uncharacterized repeat protein (TIGR01451 family)